MHSAPDKSFNFAGMKTDFTTKLLIIRLSAFGDVAMIVPVITLLARQYPQLRITVLTRSRFTPLFEWVPSNIEVKGIDLGDYQGIGGLTRLYNQIAVHNYDAVADLHNVLRTKYLRTLFHLAGKKVAVIDKQRRERHAIIGHGRTASALKSMFQRYADVFTQLGFDLQLPLTQPETASSHNKGKWPSNRSLFDLSHEDFTPIHAFAGRKEPESRWIGIAPFAAHSMKIYPLDQMHLVADMLLEKGYKVFLFGAGKEETDELATWECDDMRSVCNSLGGLHNELLLISRLDLMICMDSANMHLAAMLGTPTLSIWGATHPCAGFTAWQQTERNILHLPDLPCRPCSIYGSKPCRLGDHRCMTQIRPETIVERAEQLLSNE
jgi:ADP-heptose:LPS heptosyltransferase